jgi:hypothetical protein
VDKAVSQGTLSVDEYVLPEPRNSAWWLARQQPQFTQATNSRIFFFFRLPDLQFLHSSSKNLGIAHRYTKRFYSYSTSQNPQNASHYLPLPSNSRQNRRLQSHHIGSPVRKNLSSLVEPRPLGRNKQKARP